MEQNTSARKRTGGKKSAAAESTAAVVSSNVEQKMESESSAGIQPAKGMKTEKEHPLPGDLLVPCVSMVRSGMLVYASKRQMGYKLKWRHFGDVQFVELAELMSMRSSDSRFFSENWIAIDDSFEYKARILKVLRVDEMYANSIRPDDMSKLFTLSPAEIQKKVSGLSASMKESVYLTARNAIETGELDSIAKIRALETALDRKLM